MEQRIKINAEYILDTSLQPMVCLPADLNWDNLIDITCVGDSFRKYLDSNTGRIYNGAKYYEIVSAFIRTQLNG